VHADDRAVLADVAVLDGERFAGAVGQVRRRRDAVPILIGHPPDPQGGVVGPFLRGEPEDLLGLRAHVRRCHRAGGPARVPGVDDGRHLLEERPVPALRLVPSRAFLSVRPSLQEREQREPSREEDEGADGLADLATEPFPDPAVEGLEQPGRRAKHHEEEHGEQDPQQIPQRRGPAARAAGSFVHGCA